MSDAFVESDPEYFEGIFATEADEQEHLDESMPPDEELTWDSLDWYADWRPDDA